MSGSLSPFPQALYDPVSYGVKRVGEIAYDPWREYQAAFTNHYGYGPGSQAYNNALANVSGQQQLAAYAQHANAAYSQQALAQQMLWEPAYASPPKALVASRSGVIARFGFGGRKRSRRAAPIPDVLEPVQ